MIFHRYYIIESFTCSTKTICPQQTFYLRTIRFVFKVCNYGYENETKIENRSRTTSAFSKVRTKEPEWFL